MRALLTLYWILTGASLLAAVLASVRALRLSRRLERLTESYWDLRYELSQLSARVGRVEAVNRPAPEPATRQAGQTAFVPISSLKR